MKTNRKAEIGFSVSKTRDKVLNQHVLVKIGLVIPKDLISEIVFLSGFNIKVVKSLGCTWRVRYPRAT